jgi:hypothetical protein
MRASSIRLGEAEAVGGGANFAANGSVPRRAADFAARAAPRRGVVGWRWYREFFKKGRRLTAFNRERAWAKGRVAGRHDATEGIVAAIGVADTDYDHAGHLSIRIHPRSMRRSRKWVAQEMHGS